MSYSLAPNPRNLSKSTYFSSTGQQLHRLLTGNTDNTDQEAQSVELASTNLETLTLENMLSLPLLFLNSATKPLSEPN